MNHRKPVRPTRQSKRKASRRGANVLYSWRGRDICVSDGGKLFSKRRPKSALTTRKP